ncbi:UDP-2,4-diacetamido-2,4,6-trideoxy-beta-L-altropyranose hydrolase [Fusibacter sp. JL298sf-3]
MIGLRVDANAYIATGHVMRCVAIAQQLKAPYTFIVSDAEAQTLIASLGHPCVCLNSDWRDKEGELERLDAFIKEANIDTLLVDSYQVTPQYLAALKARVRLAYIDDLSSPDLPVDLLINYNLEATLAHYSGLQAKCLLGAAYIPLRKEFNAVAEPRAVRDAVRDVLVTTGGSDPFRFSQIFASEALKDPALEGIRLHLVIGGLYGEVDELERLAEAHSTVYLHHKVSDMAALMRRCDAAVSAGGTTLAELCAVGVPTVCFALADNQLAGIRQYSAAGAMLSAGAVSGDAQVTALEALRLLKTVIEDGDRRRAMVACGRRIVDGHGAERIAKAL